MIIFLVTEIWVRKTDNLPPSCAVVTKSGNLNFLEPSGPLRACNGTALPLPLLRSFLTHGATNPGCHVARATEFCMVVPSICGSLMWNLVHVALQAPWIMLVWMCSFIKADSLSENLSLCSSHCRGWHSWPCLHQRASQQGRLLQHNRCCCWVCSTW